MGAFVNLVCNSIIFCRFARLLHATVVLMIDDTALLSDGCLDNASFRQELLALRPGESLSVRREFNASRSALLSPIAFALSDAAFVGIMERKAPLPLLK